MNKLSLLAAALLFAAPSFAQEFFGITPEDAQAMIGQAKADEHLQRLKELGQNPNNFSSVGKVLGFTKTLDSRQECVIDAVEARMGVSQLREGTQFPDILYASGVNFSLYRSAVKAQFPSSPAPRDFVSVYLPDYDAIYIADASSAYPAGTTVDDALAAQYARFLDRTQRGVSDPARVDADAAAVQAWYRAQYPAGRSSCAN